MPITTSSSAALRGPTAQPPRRRRADCRVLGLAAQQLDHRPSDQPRGRSLHHQNHGDLQTASNTNGAGRTATMKVRLLPCGRLRVRKNIFLPTADRIRGARAPVSSALLRHPQANVLLDTGFHPRCRKDGAPLGGPPTHDPDHAASVNVVAGLGGFGFSRRHRPRGGFASASRPLRLQRVFPHCNFLVRRMSSPPPRAPGGRSGPAIKPADWVRADPDRPDREGHDLFSDGRIMLLPLPRHTPGSLSALAPAGCAPARFCWLRDTMSPHEALDTRILHAQTPGTASSSRCAGRIDGVFRDVGHDHPVPATTRAPMRQLTHLSQRL